MKALQLAAPGERLSVLCLGAHSDDIEIGAGATLLEPDRARCSAGRSLVRAQWCRGAGGEARASAADFLSGGSKTQIEVMPFQDGFFPEQGEAIKSWFEDAEGTRQSGFDFYALSR